MKIGIQRILPITITLGLIGSAAFAALELVDQNTKTVGATTVTWDSSFQDLSYTVGDTIEMEVSWTVDAGSARFDDFVLRFPEFTPKGPDPADGDELLTVALIEDSFEQDSTGVVRVEFRFTDLHCDEQRDVEIGNAHFSLRLAIDEDGDGFLDSTVGYGVNVHVEDTAGGCIPATGRPTEGGPPDGVGNGRPPWAR